MNDDLQRAAYHEAAHAVALGSGEITLAFCFLPGASRIIGDTTATEWTRPAALAGAVAEALLYGRDFDPADLSDTDREHAGSYTDADIDATFVLVDSLWEQIAQRAATEVVGFCNRHNLAYPSWLSVEEA